jgi:hypothetical protein
MRVHDGRMLNHLTLCDVRSLSPDPPIYFCSSRYMLLVVKQFARKVVCKWCLPFYAFSIFCKDRSLAAPDLSLKPLSRSSEVTSQSLTVYKMPPSSICNSILTCSAIRNHTPPHLPISIATWRSSRLINPRRLPRNQSKPQ